MRLNERARKYTTPQHPVITTLEKEYNLPHTTLCNLGKNIAPRRQSVREALFDGHMKYLWDTRKHLLTSHYQEAENIRQFMFRAFLEYHGII